MPLDSAVPAIDIDADFWSLRFVEEASDNYAVRKNVALPFATSVDRGVMATRLRRWRLRLRGDRRHVGRRRAPRACARARNGHASPRGSRSPIRARCRAPRRRAGTRRLSPVVRDAVAARHGSTCCSRNRTRSKAIRASSTGKRASMVVRTTQRLVTSDGGDVVAGFPLPDADRCSVTAHADGDTQTRTLNGYHGFCQQGGAEVLDALRLRRQRRGGSPTRRSSCSRRPTARRGTMDVLLMPDQMMLQIHESIGHPLELDRILGDERNFAGTSFVTLDMFGHYRYGSRPAQRHLRSDARRGARELRLRRRRHAGREART